MLRQRDILCLSSIDWDFVWQGHQEVMSRLARDGNRVLFIETTGVRAPRLRDLPRLRQRWRNWRRGVQGIRRVAPRLYVYAPLALPWPYAWWARWINRWLMHITLRPWMRTVGFTQPIAWAFLPTPLTMDVLRMMQPDLTIYYCIDSFLASSPQAKHVGRTERRLIREADLVFVTSKALHDYCAQWSTRVHDFPFGVDLEGFDAELRRGEGAAVPADLGAVPGPRIGYVGGVHQWVDQTLVRDVALQHPDWSFVLVGPVQTDVSALAGVRNIHLLGPKPHAELPHYLRGFDVCMIPYQLTEYTRHVYPTKLNEYCAVGRPVVSTALPEVVAVAAQAPESVLIAHQAAEFGAHVEHLLRNGRVGVGPQRAIAQAHSWSAMVSRMSQLIEAAIAERSSDQESHWMERLRAVWSLAMRRLRNTACLVAVLYGLVFHTPLLWWLAAPLTRAQAPRPADMIVVFAGGMGESGEVGQGYAERVDQAVQLYRAHYAPQLLFVSGYTYVLKEANMMRALAMELGVPAQAVQMETQAVNTYEGVVRTAQRLRAAGVNTVLFVSSPYHMRRATAVFQRQAPWLTVIPVPVTHSEFYAHRWGASLHQIKGIAEEYAALLYYVYRGWL